MSRYCLDTSAYSFFNRGDPAVVEALDGADWVGVPSVTLGELETGFLLGGRRRRNRAILREFLDNPVVEEVVVDYATARIYADLIVFLRRAGTPVPTNDLWIAAAAMQADAAVLTYDPHFERMPQVRSIVFPQPESTA